jgi:cytidylate kinase
MAQQLILINGIPGAGKTTLSKQLERHLNIAVLSKDTLMDAFADATAATVQDSQLGALASETMWQLAGLIMRSAFYLGPVSIPCTKATRHPPSGRGGTCSMGRMGEKS